MPGLDGYAGAVSDDVLPTELIGDAEAVVSRRIHRIECPVHPVRRILVARSVVVLVEQARLPPERVESVCDTVGRSPGVNVVAAIVAALHDKFRRIFKALQ